MPASPTGASNASRSVSRRGPVSRAQASPPGRPPGLCTVLTDRALRPTTPLPDAHEPFEPSRGDWPAYWQPERDFSLKHHVRHLPKGMDHASLTAYLGSVVNTPPPFDRSPWECVVRRVTE